MFRAFRATKTFTRTARTTTIRQTYSTESAHHAAATPKSDLPWIVASIAVFGPTIFYLTSPPSLTGASHGTTAGHADHSSGKEQHASPTHKEPESESESEPVEEVVEEVAEVEEPVVEESKKEEEAEVVVVGKEEKKEIEKASEGEGEEVPQEKKAEGSSEAKASAKSKQPEGHGDSEKVKQDKAVAPEEGKKEGGSE